MRLLIPVIFCFFTLCSQGQEMEQKLKLAFMERFTRFITWPEEVADSDNFVFCVVGENPFGDFLEEFCETQLMKDKPILLLDPDSIPEYGECHMLYYSGVDHDSLIRILEHTKSKPVLTIGDHEGYCEAGMIINFYQDGEYLRFEINEDAAKESDLKISYLLLKNARIVSSEEE